MRKLLRLIRVLLCLVYGFAGIAAPGAAADGTEARDPANEHGESPWLLVPTFSSDPKVGTSVGGMGGYLFKLDPGSTSSMAGAMATYSNTDSSIAGVFLRSYWDADGQRLNAAIAGGQIRNDYDDFLGSGLPLSTTDDLSFFFARYLREVRPHWFVGAQGVYTNYLIVGDDFLTEEILKLLGLTGFDSGALGLVAMFDDRDNQNSPKSGQRLIIDNFAYRESLGGEDDFDTLKIDYRNYQPHGDGNVLAFHLNGRWTSDAPPSGFSSVALRGYVRGQFLAPHSLLFEVEERRRLTGRFGLNLFAGVACLYGDGERCEDSENIYPAIGIGGQYLLKESEQMVVTMDYAEGENDNRGFYVRFGQAF